MNKENTYWFGHYLGGGWRRRATPFRRVVRWWSWVCYHRCRCGRTGGSSDLRGLSEPLSPELPTDQPKRSCWRREQSHGRPSRAWTPCQETRRSMALASVSPVSLIYTSVRVSGPEELEKRLVRTSCRTAHQLAPHGISLCASWHSLAQ